MRDNLIITRCGRKSLHHVWLDGETEASCNWDLWLAPYEADFPQGAPSSEVIPGQKWDGLNKIIARTSNWREYKYIALVDDDIFCRPGTWSKFFDRMKQFDAKLGAPAMAPGSIASHPVTIQYPGCVARATSFVEIMTPCFRVDILEKLRWTFALTTTGIGWGLDYLWAQLLEHEGIYVIDDTPVIHWRPGNFSEEKNRECRIDMETIMLEHRVTPIEMVHEFFQ